MPILQFPNIFALNLAIPEEKVMKQVEAHGPKHADKMKEAGQSDEADKSRTQVSQIHGNIDTGMN